MSRLQNGASVGISEHVRKRRAQEVIQGLMSRWCNNDRLKSSCTLRLNVVFPLSCFSLPFAQIRVSLVFFEAKSTIIKMMIFNVAFLFGHKNCFG